jgi:hypothetical protein
MRSVAHIAPFVAPVGGAGLGWLALPRVSLRRDLGRGRGSPPGPGERLTGPP